MKNFEEAQITIISLAECDDILTASGDSYGSGGELPGDDIIGGTGEQLLQQS